MSRKKYGDGQVLRGWNERGEGVGMGKRLIWVGDRGKKREGRGEGTITEKEYIRVRG